MNRHSETTDILFKAILRLETVEECYDFFEDLCTVKEVRDMSQRLAAAMLLNEGESYQTISERANISSATICRVNKCLNYGSGGYRTAIEKMKKDKGEGPDGTSGA